MWFLELNAARTGTGFGANPLSFTEIFSWSALTRVRLRPWEVAALRRLDTEFLNVMRG